MNIEIDSKNIFQARQIRLPDLLCLIVGIIFFIILPMKLAHGQSQNTAVVLTLDSAIGPATADYIHRGIAIGAKQHASLIIIQLDTPGGLDQSMREIIKNILASPIPIATYVAPSGARAASAGTYILYASPIAAMAPGTNIGAATPVSMGGSPIPGNNEEKPNKQANQASDMTKKIKKDAAAYLHSLAKIHGRNVDWSQKAVLEADSIPADKALAIGVIDLIAKDIPDLLKNIDGKKVKLKEGWVTLKTKNTQVTHFKPDWRTQFLTVITNPSFAYILLLIGIYGLFFEFANPGFVLPGVAGAICLLIALYALQLLPINYVGLGLIFMGIAFMVAEAFLPSFGALGLGGIIAFAVGSVMLMDADIPGYGIPWTLILTMVIANGLFFFVVICMAIRARQQKIVSGREALMDKVGIINGDFDTEGWIRIDGENWHCKSTEPLKKGQSAQIIDQEGLTLLVKPRSES